MGSLNDIVNVSISTLTGSVLQPGFGVPLIADYHTRFAERVRFYAGNADGLTAMLADGFTVNDAAFKAASALTAQSPAPERFAVGRRALAPDLQIDLLPVATNLTVYEVELVGTGGQVVTVSYASDASALVSEIVGGLVSAINTAAVGIVATNVGPDTTVRCKAGAPGTWFSVSVKLVERIAIAQTHADPGIAADLAAMRLETDAFYGVTLTTQGSAEVLAAANWIEANKKISVLTSQDSDLLTNSTTDTASDVKAANDFRTHVPYRRNGASFYGAALLGSVLALDPGTVTFWGRKLAGQTVDALTESQITNLKNKNAGWFSSYGGIAISRDGKAASGEFLDIIRDRDWLESRIQTDVYQVLTNSNKIPFTDKGAGAIVAAVKGRLLNAVDVGVLADDPAPVVTAPLVSATLPADRAARRYKTIRFQARLAGAIFATDIVGTITV